MCFNRLRTDVSQAVDVLVKVRADRRPHRIEDEVNSAAAREFGGRYEV
jgi:hypothetical protein